MTDPQLIAAQLPPPRDVERRCMALAMLDAILVAEWEYRYYSFNRAWDTKAGTRMGSMRNGSGDDYFVLFFPDGAAAMKGFAHESPVPRRAGSIPGVLDGIPDSFAAFTSEPAFDMNTATFALWNTGGRWERSARVAAEAIEQDGSAELLELLLGTPDDYVVFASVCFEIEVQEAVVARFFNHEPLTQELLEALRPGAVLGECAEDLTEIGYPVAR